MNKEKEVWKENLYPITKSGNAFWLKDKTKQTRTPD